MKFQLTICSLLLVSFASAHPGGLDANGGHTNRKTGEYHSHRATGANAPVAPSTAISVQSFAPVQSEQQTPADQQLVCTKVVDGDTIKLSNGETVRLIGVDTPETVHPNKPVEYFGKEASAFTKSIVEGQPVTLQYDQDSRDKYRRLLAYVHLADGRSVNEMIVFNGYGHAYTKYPFQHMELYREYERQAREAGRGLWADPQAATASPTPTTLLAEAGKVYITPSGTAYHVNSCKFSRTGKLVSIQQAQSNGLRPCKVCKP